MSEHVPLLLALDSGLCEEEIEVLADVALVNLQIDDPSELEARAQRLHALAQACGEDHEFAEETFGGPLSREDRERIVLLAGWLAELASDALVRREFIARLPSSIAAEALETRRGD